MIITRAPFRISLGGGGTDLPSYYSKFGGSCVSAAIDKYVFLTVNQSFKPEMHLRYSETEHVLPGRYDQIKHPILREALKMTGIERPIEITSMADILSGTGVGSSGSFTVALLKALHTYKRNFISPQDLAEQACKINMGILNSGSGKQDEYASAFGGINYFQINKQGVVTVTPLAVEPDTLHDLEERILLFFTGFTRSSERLLKEQAQKTEEGNLDVVGNLHITRTLGESMKDSLETGDTLRFGALLDEHWQNKKARSQGISSSAINELYDFAKSCGAVGGKIMGAGGGGFLMFYADKPGMLRKAMQKKGLQEVRFRFDFEGVKTVYSVEEYRIA